MAHYSDHRLVKPKTLQELLVNAKARRKEFIDWPTTINCVLTDYFGRDSGARSAYYGPLIKALKRKEPNHEISGEKKAERCSPQIAPPVENNEIMETKLRTKLSAIADSRRMAAQRHDDPNFEGDEDNEVDREVVEKYKKELENLPPNGRR